MTNHTLMINVPTTEDMNDLYDYVGIDTVLVFTYPKYNSALLFNQDAELLAAVTGSNERLVYGYDQETNPLTYYAINCQWVTLNAGELVKVTGFCVCVVPNY